MYLAVIATKLAETVTHLQGWRRFRTSASSFQPPTWCTEGFRGRFYGRQSSAKWRKSGLPLRRPQFWVHVDRKGSPPLLSWPAIIIASLHLCKVFALGKTSHYRYIQLNYCDLFGDELSSDVSLNDVGLAHVPHSEHEAELAVSLIDDGIPAEQESLSSLLRPRQFGEHYAHHEGLDHHPNQTLETHHKYCLRAFISRVLGTITCKTTLGIVSCVIN